MNTPFFISWRYQRGKQKNPLVTLIAKFSAIGIALGVAVFNCWLKCDEWF
ncbi:ABC-type transport system, involved in lipoprotein release, permease component [Haemophilus influenzae R3021]|uniref:ABC-type transport system, involved in lipoprotein release, permease component n=1 Tax=Haemophilus influenzae R3021 TaxID=375432 RepID=A4N6L4_HAEIF|nr:ABC-type transport system, involved in lipoprotein release, permease component [Haemophilus influenzae R3021]